MASTVFIWILLGGYLLLVTGTVLVVLLENRQPERTIAWVVAIILLPVIGLIVFYFFGQNIRRRRRHRKRHNLSKQKHQHYEVQNETEEELKDRFKPLKMLCAEEFGAKLLPLEHVDIYNNGSDFLIALLRDIAKAKSYVYLETYIIEDDPVGRLVADVLTDAAKRGVDVRLLYDDVGCWQVPMRFFRRMEQHGVQTASFMPVRFPSLTHKINYRNHRKVCVVDGESGYVGGMNLALRYIGSADYTWRDMHLRTIGAAVRRLEDIFLSDWMFVTGDTAQQGQKDADIPPSSPDGPKVQIVTSDPVTAVPQLLTAYTWAVMHARKYLYLQTPYFMPTEPFLQALKTVSLAGTDVRVMMPKKPDGKMLRRINDSYISELLAAGVRVYLFEGGFLHSKCIAVDDVWCTVGSANMDFRSFLNNIEVGALFYDPDTCAAVRTCFERDMKQCQEVDATRWAGRSLFRRLLESATRILSPLF